MKQQNKQQRIPFKKNDTKKILKNESPFAVKEAYNSIRTNIMFTNMGQKCPVLVISSPLPNDGKTINCINLAVSFAQMGKKTLLIDADLRNPTMHHFFESSLDNGVSEILVGFETNVHFETTNYPDLKYLNAGKLPPNPAVLLGNGRLDKLLQVAQEHFDYIFIDTPPVCLVTDASVLAKKVTGYILIIRDGKSDILVVKQAVSILEQVGANIVGFILNDINPKTQPRYTHYKQKYHNYDYDYKCVVKP